MTISESNKNLISQALVLAADKYIEFALEAEQMKGGERIANQFIKQSERSRWFAMVIAESGSEVSFALSDAEASELLAEATKITAQQVIATRTEQA